MSDQSEYADNWAGVGQQQRITPTDKMGGAHIAAAVHWCLLLSTEHHAVTSSSSASLLFSFKTRGLTCFWNPKSATALRNAGRNTVEVADNMGGAHTTVVHCWCLLLSTEHHAVTSSSSSFYSQLFSFKNLGTRVQTLLCLTFPATNFGDALSGALLLHCHYCLTLCLLQRWRGGFRLVHWCLLISKA